MASRAIETVLADMAAAKTQLDNLAIEVEKIERATERTFVGGLIAGIRVADKAVSLTKEGGHVSLSFAEAKSLAGWIAKHVGMNGPVKDE